MNGIVITLLSTTASYVALIVLYVYRQGKADGERSQIIQRVTRIENILNNKE